MSKNSGLRIHPLQPLVTCNDPDKPFLIFMNKLDKIIAQAGAVSWYILVVGKLLSHPVKFIETVLQSSNPDVTGSILM